MVHKQIQNWHRSISRGYSFTLIFLISFNTIVQLTQSVNTREFCLWVLDILPEKPKINSYIYALWDEPDSNEPAGWYRTKGTSCEDGDKKSLLEVP